MIQTVLERGGQYYPTDSAGVIDEWAALAYQQDYLWNQQLEKDKVDKRLRQKQYLDELDLQKKNKTLQAQEDNDKLRKEMDNRINALKAFELEQAKQKAEELKKEQDDMLKYTKRLKNDRDQEREREKEEYRMLCERSNQKLRGKEDALAEYYRQIDRQMQDNNDMHMKMVYSPEKEKLNKLMEIQDKDHENFIRKQAQGDDNGYINRLKNNQLLVAENDKLMKNRKYMKELDDLKQREDDIAAQGEKNAFQFGRDADLETERQKKNLYKQTLLYQQAMNEHNRHNFGKMTEAEKRLNKLDLKAYRFKQPQIYSMVPGINNIQYQGHNTDVSTKRSIIGDLAEMPLTARYDANKSAYPYRPQLTQRAKGLNAVQSMLILPDAGSIRSVKGNVFDDSKRESVLQVSARKSLQL